MSFDGDGDAGWVFVFCYCLVRILTLPPLFEKLSREMTYLLDLSGHTVVWRTGSESIRPLSAAGLGRRKVLMSAAGSSPTTSTWRPFPVVINWGRRCEPQSFRRALWREDYLLGVPEHVETWILLEVWGSMYVKRWKHALAPGGGHGTLAPTCCQLRSGHPVPSLQGFCAPPGIPGEGCGKAPPSVCLRGRDV